MGINEPSFLGSGQSLQKIIPPSLRNLNALGTASEVIAKAFGLLPWFCASSSILSFFLFFFHGRHLLRVALVYSFRSFPFCSKACHTFL